MKTTALSIAAIAVLAVGISGCGTKKPTKLELTTQSVSINNALLDSKHTFVPKDARLKTSNWAYEIESEIKGDYFFENNAMVKVFLLAHNADRIIILGEGRVAKQYRNYFRNNGVDAYIDVQEIDMKPEYKNRVKIMFFSSKANYEDYRKLPTYRAIPLNDESYKDIESHFSIDEPQGNILFVIEKDKKEKPINTQKNKPKKKSQPQPKAKSNVVKDKKPTEQCPVSEIEPNGKIGATPTQPAAPAAETQPTIPTIEPAGAGNTTKDKQ